MLFFTFSKQCTKQDYDFPHKHADVTRTSAEINQRVRQMPQSSSGSGRKTNICQKLSTRQALAGCFNTQSHFMLLLTCLTGETKVAQGHPASSSTSRSKPRCSWPPCACFFFFFLEVGAALLCTESLCHDLSWHFLGMCSTVRFMFSDF